MNFKNPEAGIMSDGPDTDYPMSDRQIEQWISACNHEPAREVLREYLRLRRTPATEPAAAGEAGLVDAVLLEDMSDGHHPKYGKGLFTTHNCVRQLYLHLPAAPPLPAPEPSSTNTRELKVAREFMQAELDLLAALERDGRLAQDDQDRARSIAILLKAAGQVLPVGGATTAAEPVASQAVGLLPVAYRFRLKSDAADDWTIWDGADVPEFDDLSAWIVEPLFIYPFLPAGGLDEQAERRLFETGLSHHHSFSRHELSGEYRSLETACAWHAWLARSRLSRGEGREHGNV